MNYEDVKIGQVFTISSGTPTLKWEILAKADGRLFRKITSMDNTSPVLDYDLCTAICVPTWKLLPKKITKWGYLVCWEHEPTKVQFRAASFDSKQDALDNIAMYTNAYFCSEPFEISVKEFRDLE